ncbi:MAG TPA: 30S ribosomal protein S16 [Bacillota bacterium]|nr:30S ribosomal protein S16 [Bacillota bacterium]
MVRIRLRRMGAKKHPFYRLVVADNTSPRDGRFIEEIGYYNPTVQPPVIHLEAERALHWLRQGAQPSDTARSLLSRAGLIVAAKARPEV